MSQTNSLLGEFVQEYGQAPSCRPQSGAEGDDSRSGSLCRKSKLPLLHDTEFNSPRVRRATLYRNRAYTFRKDDTQQQSPSPHQQRIPALHGRYQEYSGALARPLNNQIVRRCHRDCLQEFRADRSGISAHQVQSGGTFWRSLEGSQIRQQRSELRGDRLLSGSSPVELGFEAVIYTSQS